MSTARIRTLSRSEAEQLIDLHPEAFHLIETPDALLAGVGPFPREGIVRGHVFAAFGDLRIEEDRAWLLEEAPGGDLAAGEDETVPLLTDRARTPGFRGGWTRLVRRPYSHVGTVLAHRLIRLEEDGGTNT